LEKKGRRRREKWEMKKRRKKYKERIINRKRRETKGRIRKGEQDEERSGRR
jgi:hypothetical protein